MQDKGKRRERGDGSLFLRPNAKGGETWIAKFRVDGKQVMRSVGPKRSKVDPGGLTKPQAEAKLRAMRDEATVNPSRPDRRTFADVGASLMNLKRRQGRKPATLDYYEYTIRIHVVPFFGLTPVHKLDKEDVLRYDAELEAKGLSPKSRANALGVLHTLIEHAIDEGWAHQNPVKRVPKPRPAEADADIRFLDIEEVEALLRGVPADELGQVERVMYLTAAMTGLRQGELFALRWRDIDWTAQRIRVRQNFVRGQFGTPKSKRSSRSVPLAPRVGAELDRLHQSTDWKADDDLVFAHPATGKPIDRSKLLKRYKLALKRAGVREVRFHDLRHTFGTRMAAQGVPMRTLQEMMGHRDYKTTLIYADYAPSAHEAEWVEAAFAPPSRVVADEASVLP